MVPCPVFLPPPTPYGIGGLPPTHATHTPPHPQGGGMQRHRHIYIYTYCIQLHIHILRTYTHTCIIICIFICFTLPACIHIYLFVHYLHVYYVDTYIYIYYLNMYIYIYIHNMCVYMYTCTHVHGALDRLGARMLNPRNMTLQTGYILSNKRQSAKKCQQDRTSLKQPSIIHQSWPPNYQPAVHQPTSVT